MKSILLSMICLSINFTQANTLKPEVIKLNFTQKEAKQCTQSVIEALTLDYIFPEKANIIVQKLKSKLAYAQVNKTDELEQYTNDLAIYIREVSGNSYLDITKTNAQPLIEHSKLSSSQNIDKDYGFNNVDILSGNIGYLKLDYFYQNSEAELKAAQAFDYLSGTDAMIIDLRDVEGNSISLAQYMMSFFVEESSVLIDVLYDKQQKTQSINSVTTPSNEQFRHHFPIFILTSPFVAGTGELFSYTLKHLNKAVIVGKPTMGVAFISQKQVLNKFISIEMPIAIPIHPVTQSNWEQVGVIPDFDVNVDQSFEVAYRLAKAALNIL